MLSQNYLSLSVESPGIYAESSPIVNQFTTTSDYYQAVEQYSSVYFHFKLIQMGREQFNYYDFLSEDSPCLLNSDQLVELIDYYLYDYMNFTQSEISYSHTKTNVRDFIIDNVENGNPVWVSMGELDKTDEIGHAFIVYDYDEVNDELYGHFGWKKSGKYYEHIKISTTEYDEFWNAISLNVNMPHNCSNNYKYSNEYTVTKTFCPCVHSIHENHNHYYNYTWQNNNTHLKHCGCGISQTQPHVVSSDAYNSGQRFATCLECGGSAEIGIIQLGNNSILTNKVSRNGSFILSNGVVVLVDEDIEEYMKGTLMFYNKTMIPVIK